MKNGAFALKPNEETTAAAVAIVGARGYSGVELARLLLRHPQARLAACFATAGFRLSDYLPEKAAREVPGLPVEDLLSVVGAEKVSVVFLATPAETSLRLASQLLQRGVDVIDLSGAFRLQQGGDLERADVYEKWYGIRHTALPLLSKAEFGLVPWKKTPPSSKEGARLIANPGCFATASLMAILPLLRAGVIEPSSLVIDAKSGTSGAGRKAEERLLHCEVDGVCLPYKIGEHQHEPEIRQYALRLAETAIDPFFTTHLLPVRRGIIASCYARLGESLRRQGEEMAYDSVTKAYSEVYESDPLVDFARIDRDGGDKLLSLRRVVGSPRTQIAYKVVDGKLYVFSLIDNLLKGAASQAVENFNRLVGVPTWTGLTEMEGVL